ncbi:MAG TPA: aldo/keto reductase [Burkholderiaceae bacterium]
MNTLAMPSGASIPALGLGTWRMGESRAARATELAALRSAIEMGYRLIDTAEMYGDGGAEEVVGQVVADALRAGDVRRDELFIVSKVYPHNASRKGTAAACDRTRKRLGLDQIDLYLLHWRGEHALADTAAAMHTLVDAGRIAHWGVSNFDVDDMRELMAVAPDCAANQVYFSLGERGAEFALLPWLRAQHMPLMAYSPIGQGALARHKALAAIGGARSLTAAQTALAWVLSQPGVVAIPKATKAEHLRDNLAVADLRLDPEILRRIDRLFPPPTRKQALAMI